MRDKLAGIAAKQLNILPDDIEFADGKIRSRSNPDNALPFGRVAGTAHWSPVMLPEGMAPGLSETGVWSPPELEPPTRDDRINTSLTYGFVFDMCGVEVDPVTFQVRIDRYVSMHDAGTLLNPLIADGQVRGAFAQGVAAALYEEFVYDEAGSFLSGTFADYLVPTVSEIPKLEILHQETPSPLTPLGAKGLAEGNCMSTPACIANAVADALGVKDIALPLTPRRLHGLIAGAEPPRPPSARATGAGTARIELPAETSREGRTLRGQGSFEVAAPPATVWRALLDPDSLKAVIPGCDDLRKTGENDYVAEVSLGVGPVRGRFTATVGLSDLVTEKSGRIGGALAGPLGGASGSGLLRLSPSPRGTRIDYDYAVAIGGKVAAVGGRLLDGATQVIIAQFFERLGRRLAAPAAGPLQPRPQAGQKADQAQPVAPPVRRIGGAMKPRRFDYARPDSVAEALALLAEHGDDGEGAGRRAVADGDAQPAPAGARPARSTSRGSRSSTPSGSPATWSRSAPP